jgi:hypothetical protein
MTTVDRIRAALIAALMAAALAAVAGAPPAVATSPRTSPTPVFAYYYIWFNATSWNRAKRDYPLVGRYSSDERTVMERHIRWAKQVGIDGFIVSWKSTPTLDRRLHTLIDVATKAHFKLALIYEGLDFHREPLPAAQVGADLALFASRYARAAPFQGFGKPLTIWSGTWRFTPSQIAGVTAKLRRSMLVLATEKGPRDYARVAPYFDGDAYYWSSADALRTPGHVRKLREMSAVVHRNRGLWIAPAAPGFDARMIGGRKSVPRRGGETLRQAIDHAAASSPDVLGLISWNEWSENSYVEPSKRYGFQDLHVISDVLGTHARVANDLDSSGGAPTGARYGLPVLGGFVTLLVGGGWLMARRRRGGRWRRGGGPSQDPYAL